MGLVRDGRREPPPLSAVDNLWTTFGVGFGPQPQGSYPQVIHRLSTGY